MNKLYIALLAGAAIGVGFTACSNEDDPIFSSSAAERLEQSRSEYKEVLTADGGLWAIEYFTNDEEPGYLMTMKFGTNGGVEVSADHKWIGSTFKQETSLWDIISDNGTVLTFNSFNTLFHVFSTPENIEGADAPKNDEGEDINELGYGHNGDYEFLLMSHDKEGNVKLVGKKHGMTAWLRKLPADTDPKAYLAQVSERRKVFSSKFPEFLMTESNGQTYTITGLGNGIASIYPHDFGESEADPVEQTVTAHGVMTPTGFRFREPLEVKRADKSTWELSELLWQEDGSLACETARVTGPTAAQALGMSGLTWTLDVESLTGDIAKEFEKANNALIAYNSSVGGFSNITLSYTVRSGEVTPVLTFTIGKRLCRDYVKFTFPSDYEIESEIYFTDSASSRYENLVPEFVEFKKMITGAFSLENKSDIDPSVITFSSDKGSFKMSVNN